LSRTSHPKFGAKRLFEAVREDLLENAAPDLQRGSIFYDLHAAAPYRLDFFAASVKDGRDNQIHRRLFAVQAETQPSTNNPQLSVKQPTVLLDLAVAPQSAQAPASDTLPDRTAAEQFLIQTALTLLYHLARNGSASHRWAGVPQILAAAGVKEIRYMPGWNGTTAKGSASTIGFGTAPGTAWRTSSHSRAEEPNHGAAC
jgi:hypothetical protein